jgi:hypothetical protein
MEETTRIKRCGICLRLCPANDVELEDGVEKCPGCFSGRDAAFEAADEARAAKRVASWYPAPQRSNKPLSQTFPGTIRKITDENGVHVYSSAPLALVRGVAKTLLLLGRAFSASDTITGDTGLTISVTDRTTSQTTLSVTADVSMTPSDHYGLTFNDVVFRSIFSVR